MFDEYDDEDLEMIDSITEEDDEDTDFGKPCGVTISEVNFHFLSRIPL